MINLTEQDKEIIRHLGYPKIVSLSQGKYLVKADYQNTSINELIGKKLADIMGIVCPRYFLVDVDNKKYILSEDLNQYGKFIPAIELGEKYEDEFESYPLNKLYQDESWYDEDAKKILHGNSLYDIWSYFENNYSSDISKSLMDEILKVYMFDILFLNYDRDTRNWGILTQKDQVNVIILDNELIFTKKSEENEDNDDKQTESSCYAETVSLNVNFKKEHAPVYEDFRQFLKESSTEFITSFKYYLDLITPEFLRKIIEQIEKSNDLNIADKEEKIAIYQKHHNALQTIYNEEMTKENKASR